MRKITHQDPNTHLIRTKLGDPDDGISAKIGTATVFSNLDTLWYSITATQRSQYAVTDG